MGNDPEDSGYQPDGSLAEDDSKTLRPGARRVRRTVSWWVIALGGREKCRGTWPHDAEFSPDHLYKWNEVIPKVDGTHLANSDNRRGWSW